MQITIHHYLITNLLPVWVDQVLAHSLGDNSKEFHLHTVIIIISALSTDSVSLACHCHSGLSIFKVQAILFIPLYYDDSSLVAISGRHTPKINGSLRENSSSHRLWPCATITQMLFPFRPHKSEWILNVSLNSKSHWKPKEPHDSRTKQTHVTQASEFSSHSFCFCWKCHVSLPCHLQKRTES